MAWWQCRQCKQSVRRSSLSPERKAREPQSTRLPRQAKEPGQPPNTLKPQSRVQQLVDGICRAKGKAIYARDLQLKACSNSRSAVAGLLHNSLSIVTNWSWSLSMCAFSID